MVIAFMPEFVPKILSGVKIHTLREDKSRRWKPGTKMHMATGVRTKSYTNFMIHTCTSIQSVKINPAARRVEIDFRRLDMDELFNFVMRDGFDSVDEFFKFFPDPVTLRLLHWTTHRY